MRVTDPNDATPSTSAVLIDNTLIYSAARLLSGHYDSNEIVKYREQDLPATLLLHDLFALASLCESIVLCEEIFVNAGFLEVWGDSYELRAILDDIVVGLTFSEDLLAAAADALPVLDNHLGLSTVARRAAEVVYAGNYDCERLDHTPVRRLFLDPVGNVESDRSRRLMAGTAFYILASQLLGVPYRPSALRSEMLARRAAQELRRMTSPDPREILQQVMERGRDAALDGLVDAIRAYFDTTLEVNELRIKLPNIFMAVLSQCASADEILPRALSLRDADGAHELRSMLGDLTWSLRAGEIPRAGKYFREIERLASSVNRDLGMSPYPQVDVSLQYGPVSVGPLFSVPKLIARSPRLGRQMFFLREQYGQSLRARSAEEQIVRLLVPVLPEGFRSSLGWRDMNL